MIVGVDIGYGYTKAVGGGRQVAFPSVVGKAERIRYESDLGLHTSEPTHGQGIALITEEGDRFVGELALLQSRVQWTLLDRSRVEDTSARLLFLAALSELTGERAPEFQVVTGLPVKWYGDRDKVIAHLQGRHHLRRFNGRETLQRMTVTEVLVVPQPFGSLFSAILGSEGQLTDEALANGRLAVIDIGTYTTDYVLVDRLRYIEKGSHSIETAMASAYHLIARTLLDTHGLDLNIHQVDQAVRRGQVAVYGETRDIEWLVNPALDAVAEQVLAEAATLWGDARDLDTILVTGGGAMALGQRICRRYRHARVLENAASANVTGFERYGRRKWREGA